MKFAKEQQIDAKRRRGGQVLWSRSLCDSETGFETFETFLEQRRQHSPHTGSSQKLHAPVSDGAAALGRHFERAGVAGSRNPGDQLVAIEPLRVVDRVEAFDDLPAVKHFNLAELTYSCADQAHSRDQWMPVAAELSDQRPHRVGRSRKLDGFADGLQLRVRRSEIRKHLHARFRRPGRTALEELPIVVYEPGEQDVEHVRVDRAAASRLVRASVDRALLDLEVALVGDRLVEIEQQKIVEKDISVGGKRFGRPIDLAVVHVPVGEAVLQPLQKHWLQLLWNRERGLLIPQVA